MRRSPLRGVHRQLIAIGTLVLVVFALVACGSSSDSSSSESSAGESTSGEGSSGGVKQFSDEINVSFPFLPITQFYPLELAKDEGIFEEHGLKVNVKIVGNTAINAALASGSLQFTITSPPLELANIAGVPIKLIGVYGNYTQTYLIATPGIESVKDLVGQKVGITTPDAYSSIIAKYALHKNGISDDEVTFVPLGMTMPSQAIVSGLANAVDADTTQYLLAKEGNPGVTKIEDFSKVVWPSGQIWGYTPWMESHKEETAAFLQAFNDAVVKWITDPVAAKKTIEKYNKVTDPKVLDALYAATKAEFNSGATPVQAPSYETESFINSVLRETGFPEASDSYAKEGEIWTSEYWDEAFGK
jgi:ABC-type nitrate/sulfonate/bicarbonate transport system substrate-binding protein